MTNVFLPNNNDPPSTEIKDELESALPMERPIKPFSPAELISHITKLSNNKAPGPDKITAAILKELPRKGVVLLTTLFNSVLRLGYFPQQWKKANVHLILKPGKDPYSPSSY